MTEMCKYKNIKQEYGEGVLRNIREYEKLSKIYGRYTSHLRFNLQCKHCDLIPNSVKIAYQIGNPETRKIIHKAEKAILNVRVTETIKKKKFIEKKRIDIHRKIQECVPPTLFEQITMKGEKYRVDELQKSSDRQKKKYRMLRYGIVEKRNEIGEIRNNQRLQPEQRIQDEIEVDPGEEEESRSIENGDGEEVETGVEDKKIKERWVKNISKRKLTPTEKEVLSKGAGFAIVPTKIPYDEYIVATEIVCKNIPKGQAAALKSEITEVLQRAESPKSNISREERQALKDLKADKSIIIIPADKGKCLVIMNKDDYIEKMEMKLSDVTTYKRINNDPTNEIKEMLTDVLKQIRDKGEIDQKEYLKLLPSKTQIPRMYGQPKVHKDGYPMREIVDGSGGVAKDIDKYVSKIFKTYVGESEHYVRNSSHFVSMIENLRVEKDEVLVSYDVKALYPSVPQEEAIELMHGLLKEDTSLKTKTHMSAESIISLFKTCVRKTYFTFNKKLYMQVNGLAIGVATSGFAAEIFMGRLERKALSSFIEPPRIWKRYVDDTFTKLKIGKVDMFLEHLNSQHNRIEFTTEVQKDNKIAFLDTEVHVKDDGSTKVTIYRKATHTDQYLHFGSNHHIKQKMGLITNFRHRIEMLVTEEEDKYKEEKHVKQALKRCGHPEWVLKKRKKKENKEQKDEPYGKVVIPYIKKLSERIAGVFRRYNIETIHKPTNTIKSTVCVGMKDKIHDLDKIGVIYHIKCNKHDVEYVGETERALKTRLYEHKIISHKQANLAQSLQGDQEENDVAIVGRRSGRNKERKNYKKMNDGSEIILSEGNTEVSTHMAGEEHKEGDVDYKIVGREENWWKRGIKEAIKIKEIRPVLNKDEGRYFLPAIYDNIFKSNEMRRTLEGLPKRSFGNGTNHPSKINITEEDSRPL